MTWEDWKISYEKELYHEKNYEEIFVDTILAKVKNITPEMVIPQYHFVDSKGKNRYIDFVILIDKKFIPIELDGKQKFDTYNIFDDTFARQNDLVKQFGFLLRYSNKRMFNEPQSIIDELTKAVENLKQDSNINALKELNFKIYKENIELELNKLKETLSETHIKQLEDKLNKLEQKSSKSTLKIITIFLIIILSTIALIYIINNVKIEPNCGKVYGVKKVNKATYLNIDGIYPNQRITFVIWDRAFSKDINPERYLKENFFHKNICVNGKHSEYNGKPQIEINNLSDIFLKDK